HGVDIRQFAPALVQWLSKVHERSPLKSPPCSTGFSLAGRTWPAAPGRPHLICEAIRDGSRRRADPAHLLSPDRFVVAPGQSPFSAIGACCAKGCPCASSKKTRSGHHAKRDAISRPFSFLVGPKCVAVRELARRRPARPRPFLPSACPDGLAASARPPA